MTNIYFGDADAFRKAMRPNTKPDQFRDQVPFRIKDIRAWAKHIMGHPVTDEQIIKVCHTAGLIHRKAPSRSISLLEHLTETELYRMWKWIGQQVLAAGYDSYFREQQR